MAGSLWEKGAVTLDDGSKAEAQLPVIVSASRSTDIPACYADWFMERLDKGYVKWFNPFNNKPLYVGFTKTRLIVFWSKNPKPLLRHLETLDRRGINYYFQFTLNDYVAEKLEPGVPSVEERVATFGELSKRLGKDRVVWRFDPLVLSSRIGVEQLAGKIERLGDSLAQYTTSLVFSFIDIGAYIKVGRNLKQCVPGAREFHPDEMEDLAARIGKLAKSWGITARTCAEKVNLGKYGIEPNRCIDDRLILNCFSHDSALMKFIGAEPPSLLNDQKWTLGASKKDPGQRAACGCIASKDIGQYNTCPHQCIYCYANTSPQSACANCARHRANPHAESILGE